MAILTEAAIAQAISSRDPDELIDVIGRLHNRRAKPASRNPRVEAIWSLKKTAAAMVEESIGVLTPWYVSMDNRDPDNISVTFFAEQGELCSDFGPYTVVYHHQGNDNYEPRSVYYPSGGRWMNFSDHVDQIRAIAQYIVEKFESCPEFYTQNALDYDGDALPYPDAYTQAATAYRKDLNEKMARPQPVVAT